MFRLQICGLEFSSQIDLNSIVFEIDNATESSHEFAE